MVKIVLKPKYKALARKNVVVDVKAGRKNVMKKRWRGRRARGGIRSLAEKIARVNCEKKEYNVYSAGLTVGQIYVPSAGATIQSGHYMTNGITPLPLNGTTDTSRLGDEFLVTGIRNIFQFSQMSNTSQGIKGRLMIVSPSFRLSGASLTIDKIFNSNPIIYAGQGGAAFPVVYDTTCARNMDYVKDIKVLRNIPFYFPPDSASLSQKLVKTIDASLKFKKPWKMRFDTAGNLSYGQLYAVVLCESGNTTANVPSVNTVGVPITDTLSALNLNWYSKSYFIDP